MVLRQSVLVLFVQSEVRIIPVPGVPAIEIERTIPRATENQIGITRIPFAGGAYVSIRRMRRSRIGTRALTSRRGARAWWRFLCPEVRVHHFVGIGHSGEMHQDGRPNPASRLKFHVCSQFPHSGSAISRYRFLSAPLFPSARGGTMSRLYLAVVLFIVPATLRAQEAFTPLDSGLTVGETIHVLVDAPCATKACPGELVKGKVAKLSDASLVVDDGGLKPARVGGAGCSLFERPTDRIWNGLLAGFVVGFAVGFGSVMLDGCEREPCLFDSSSFAAAAGIVGGGIGAGVGAITDALISRQRVVFVRPATSRVVTSIAPGVGVHSGGVSLTVRF